MQNIQLTSWESFKTICITQKNLSCQYQESDDSYQIYGPDSGSIIWCSSIAKDGNEDQIDFEQNYKSAFNWAIGQRSYAFATGDFDFIGDGAFFICAAGQSKFADYLFPEDLYIDGGNIVLEKSVIGDWVEVGIFLPNKQDPLKTYIRQRFVPAAPTGSPSPNLIIKTPYAAKIPRGLILRLTYHSTGQEDVKIGINYDLHRAI